jgi:hypothetical protein
MAKKRNSNNKDDGNFNGEKTAKKSLRQLGIATFFPRAQNPSPRTLAEQEDDNYQKESQKAMAASLADNSRSSIDCIDLTRDSDDDMDASARSTNSKSASSESRVSTCASQHDEFIASPLQLPHAHVPDTTRQEDVACKLACPVCTFLNQLNYVSCGMCSTTRAAGGSHGSDDTAADDESPSAPTRHHVAATDTSPCDSDKNEKKPAALPSPSELPAGFVFDDLKWQLCTKDCKGMHEDCDKYCCEDDHEDVWKDAEDPDEEYEEDAIDDANDCYQIPQEAMKTFPTWEEYEKEGLSCMRTKEEISFQYAKLEHAENSGLFKKNLQQVGLCPSRDKSSADGTADDTAYGNYTVPLRNECEAHGTFILPMNCSPKCPKVKDSKKRCGITISVHLVRRWFIFNGTIMLRWGPVFAINFGGSKTKSVVALLKKKAPGVYTDVQPLGIHRSVLSVPYR